MISLLAGKPSSFCLYAVSDFVHWVIRILPAPPMSLKSRIMSQKSFRRSQLPDRTRKSTSEPLHPIEQPFSRTTFKIQGKVGKLLNFLIFQVGDSRTVCAGRTFYQKTKDCSCFFTSKLCLLYQFFWPASRASCHGWEKGLDAEYLHHQNIQVHQRDK